MWSTNPKPSALSFEQLALLGKATITIADLTDGYLIEGKGQA
jgi:hypothetical protein